MKTLLIVESPAKAKKIGKFLGKDYQVEASMGHIFDLPKGNDLGVDLTTLRPKYNIMSEKKNLLTKFQQIAKGVDQILLASDPDREGEAIAFHLAEILQNSDKPIKRIKFNEITKKEIDKALLKPLDLDDNLYQAQQARRALDRLVGYLASPIVMKKLNDFHLSAGRVQSSALRMIVEREEEIEAFKPEEYWNISAAFNVSNQTKNHFVAKLQKEIDNKELADKVVTQLEQSKYFLVSAVESKPKNRPPAPPFANSDLLQVATNRMKMDASKVMKLAQSLFEGGLITYHRSDSNYTSAEAISELREYLKEKNLPYPSKPNYFKSKENSQAAHECIRPTDVNNIAENLYISDLEKQLYQIIWERFVASQMTPAVYDTMTVSIKTTPEGHILKSFGSCLREKGWLQLTPLADKESKKDLQLPVLNKGDQLYLVPPKIKKEQLFTKPANRFTESTLIKELENKGIGRPSTIATITNKIKERNYVDQKNQIYYPLPLGREVCHLLLQYFKFMDYQYTAELEDKLDQIADGKLQYLPMMTAFYQLFRTEVQKAQTSQLTSGITCQKCNLGMILNSGPYGQYYKCQDVACKTTQKFQS